MLFCTGKLYYALDAGREERDWSSVAVIRVEQLYPWPEGLVAEALRRYPGAADVCWVQEEPANQGAWDFVEWRLGRALARGQRLRYIGRPAAASPATGSHSHHEREERGIVEAALRRPRAGRRRS